jgi:hypothetical protein
MVVYWTCRGGAFHGWAAGSAVGGRPGGVLRGATGRGRGSAREGNRRPAGGGQAALLVP